MSKQQTDINIVQAAAPPLSPELVAQFRKIVGDKYAVTDAAEIAPYLTEERDLFHGRSPLVLGPGSTAEVSAICKLANEHRVALVPQGGNTGLVGGQTPHNGEVVVSLRRLDKIREGDTASNTMTCEAGVILQVAQQRAAEVERLLPPSLGADGSWTLGATLSTHAGGPAAPAAGSLTSFELLADIAVDFSIRHGINVRDPLNTKHPWYVLMELSSVRDDARAALESILGQAMEKGIVDDAVIAANLSQRQSFWKLRDEMSAAQKPEGGSIKHDISVPVAAVPTFIEEANAAVVKLIPGSRPVPFGHLGDGNIHYNVSQPIGGNTADFMSRWHEVNEVVFAIVLRMGGSISAEHGIGVLKRDELADVKDKVAIELMRGIKAMLDPLGIMNPGKVL